MLSDLKIRRTRPSKQINLHVGRQPFFFHPPSCARPSLTRVVQISKAIDTPANDEGEDQKSRSVNEDAFESVCASRRGLKTHGSKVEGTRRRNKRGFAERVSFVVRALSTTLHSFSLSFICLASSGCRPDPN